MRQSALQASLGQNPEYYLDQQRRRHAGFQCLLLADLLQKSGKKKEACLSVGP
jgi:hypothetical protein